MSKHDPARSGTPTAVSRRRFLTTAGASGVAVAFSGCADIVGDGDDEADAPSPGDATTGEVDGASDEVTTVRWGFDPVAVRENGDAIEQALHESGGLSDDVEIQWVPGASDTGLRRIDYHTLLDEGDAEPDLLLMDNGWVNSFIERGTIENLSETLSEDRVSTIDDEYFEVVTETARDSETGDLFGVPVFPDFATMQYRQDLVEAAGYDPAEDSWATEPMTWEEWSHVTVDAMEAADVEFGFTTQWDIYEGTACCTFNEVAASWGGAYFGSRENLFGPVGDRPITVDRQPVVRALNMMRRFVHGDEFGPLSGYAGGFTPPDVLGWQEEDSRDPFAHGDAVMHRNWPYSLALNGRDPSETNDPALGEDLGVMPIPYAVPESEATFSGIGGSTSALGGWHATVNPNTRRLDAVVEVLHALMEPDFQLALFEIQGWLPPRPELFESDEARDVPVVGEYLDTLRVAGESALPRPVTPVWIEQSSVIAQQANRAVGREVSSERAMASLADSLRTIEQEGAIE